MNLRETVAVSSAKINGATAYEVSGKKFTSLYVYTFLHVLPNEFWIELHLYGLSY